MKGIGSYQYIDQVAYAWEHDELSLGDALIILPTVGWRVKYKDDTIAKFLIQYVLRAVTMFEPERDTKKHTPYRDFDKDRLFTGVRVEDLNSIEEYFIDPSSYIWPRYRIGVSSRRLNPHGPRVYKFRNSHNGFSVEELSSIFRSLASEAQEEADAHVGGLGR